MSRLKTRRGVVLLVAVVFLLIFSALGVSMAAMTGTNAQIAHNHRKMNRAFSSAESGHGVMRYWPKSVSMPSTTPTSDYFTEIVNDVQVALSSNNITNVVLQDDGSVPTVPLDSGIQTNFHGQMSIDPSLPAVLQVQVTGTNQNIDSKIKTGFVVGPYEHPIFNYDGFRPSQEFEDTGGFRYAAVLHSDPSSYEIVH